MSSTRTIVIQHHNFDDLLLQAIDETFSDLLGPRFNAALLQYFGSKFRTSRGSIPSRLQEFVLAVSGIFGDLSALIIGREVARRFYVKLGLKFAGEPGYTLLDFVNKAIAKMNGCSA